MMGQFTRVVSNASLSRAFLFVPFVMRRDLFFFGHNLFLGRFC